MHHTNSVGIFGYGSFGQFIHTLISKNFSNTKVLIFEKAKEKQSNSIFSSFEETAGADILIPCVPISAYNQTISKITSSMSQASIILDICTIKKHTSDHLSTFQDLKYISTHPMFGPNSYKKQGDSLEGLRLVICKHTLPNTSYENCLNLCKKLGLDVIEQSAENHDKHLAVSLFLTHYLAQTIFAAGFDRTPIDTASFGYLMDSAEMVRENKALFEDVYTYNPYCQEMIERFNISREQIEKELKNISKS